MATLLRSDGEERNRQPGLGTHASEILGRKSGDTCKYRGLVTLAFTATIWESAWQGLLQTSLLTGWLPLLVEAVTVVLAILSIDRRHLTFRSAIKVISVSVLVVVAVDGLLYGMAIIPRNFSLWPSLWAGLGLSECGLVWLMWRRNASWRRVCGVAAILMLVICTLGSINADTETFITVHRLVAGEPDTVIHLAGVEKIQTEVAATGVLPAKGSVLVITIPNTVSHFSTKPAYVYLPPAWFASPTPSLPVLVLLPGEPGSAADWVASGDLDQTANAFAREHHGVAPIVVMPDPNGNHTVDSECVNSQFGNAETYLTTDVPNFARHQLGANGVFAIGGLSAGATCSMTLALNHPSLYPTFLSFSGFSVPQYQDTTVAETQRILFNGDISAYEAHSPVTILERNPGGFSSMAGWLEAGHDDRATMASLATLTPLARRAGIYTCSTTIPGGHDFGVWSASLRSSFGFAAWRLGLIPAPLSLSSWCRA